MLYKRLLWIANLGLATSLLGACAFGNVAPVSAPSDFAIDYKGKGTVTVAVRDQRKDVLDGSRKETLVGRQRSLYGIPFPVATASGKPFAADLADVIVNGLTATGVEVKSVQTLPSQSEDSAIAALVTSGSDRGLLFNIVEWDADTYSRTTLHYDVRLSVFDKQGGPLGQSAVAGEDVLDKSRPQRADMPTATADIIQSLLAAKPVVAALQPDAMSKTQSCTVDQILKMQQSGLGRQQIEAACPTGSSR